MTPAELLNGFYGDWFHVALYFLLFGSLARFSLEKNLGDSTAKRVAVPLGLVLAAAMWSLQQRLGLSLGSLGPISVALLLAALAGVLYRYLRWATESPLLALALCLGTMLALCASFVPQLRTGGMEVGFVAFFLLIATWVLGHARARPGTPVTPRTKTSSRLPNRGALKTIEHTLRKSMGAFPARHIKRLGKGLGKALKNTQRRRKEKGEQRSATPKLENELLSLEQEGNTLSEDLRRLLELDKALQRLDFSWLQETYNVGRHLAIQGKGRTLWRQLKVERKRLGIDKKLEFVAEKGLGLLEDLKRHLEQCRRLLRQGDRKALEKEMSRARKCGRDVSKRYLQARKLEHQLLRLYEVQEKRLISSPQ